MFEPLKPFFAVLLIALLAVSPALAGVSQGAGSEITGNGNTVIQSNEVNTAIKYAKIDDRDDIDAQTYISVVNEAPVDFTPNVNYLSVGDVEDTSFMIYPNQVIAIEAKKGTILKMKSGGVMALYTIESGNDVLELKSEYSKMEYDPIYQRFDHGTISPLTIFPFYTNKASITTTADGYIVLDNRHPFTGYTMVEVKTFPPFPEPL